MPRHQAGTLPGTMRISEMVERPKVPPGSGWRKLIYQLSFGTLNLGESPAERRYRELSGRIRRYIRRQYVIGVVSGKGGVGKTTMSTCIGSVFRECRPDTVIAIDAVPGYGTLEGRIEQTQRSSFAGMLSDTDIQGYTDIRQYLGQNDVGLDVLAGDHIPDQPPIMLPTMLNGALVRLRRSHTVLVLDTSDDLTHPVSRTVFDACDTLVFVSGLTPDTSLPVSHTIDMVRAMGYDELVSRSMIILNDSRNKYDSAARAYLAQGYANSGLSVEFMPYDPHLAKGGVIDTKYGLRKKSRLRLFEITAALADRYNLDADVGGKSQAGA
jgi:MinD-like ATPase involved in chromosome partitioning or flagellar assembly